MEIITEESWEESSFYERLSSTRYLFVIFKENENSEFVLSKAKFWNVPATDLEKIGVIWQDTVNKIRNDEVGLRFNEDTGRVENNFIASSESSHYSYEQEGVYLSDVNMLCHVRPHSKISSYVLRDGFTRRPEVKEQYSNILPSGEWMPNQCFWFNKSYLKEIADD